MFIYQVLFKLKMQYTLKKKKKTNLAVEGHYPFYP